jgi:hypothetical protein
MLRVGRTESDRRRRIARIPQGGQNPTPPFRAPSPLHAIPETFGGLRYAIPNLRYSPKTIYFLKIS